MLSGKMAYFMPESLQALTRSTKKHEDYRNELAPCQSFSLPLCGHNSITSANVSTDIGYRVLHFTF